MLVSVLNTLDPTRAAQIVFSPAEREQLTGQIGLSADHIVHEIEQSAAAKIVVLQARCAPTLGVPGLLLVRAMVTYSRCPAI